ncbi:MAG: hydroxymethylbilane synthase [Desulfovibrionaceae bacterium]|nr:hydroxymethylbilane synthase [Desulfovibrionaceae bacterium]
MNDAIHPAAAPGADEGDAPPAKQLTIATRGSPLALWQANFLAEQIKAVWPQTEVDILPVKTKGDKLLNTPLAKIGGKGVFVKEIEEALLEGRADLAVHSMKDVPMHLPEGLKIGAILERGPVEDVFLSFHYSDFSCLPPKARLGTSSLRRQAQALAVRPDLAIIPLRGNIGTRLSRLANGDMDAIILAGAGISRLNANAPHTVALDINSFIPAAGQGALGVEYCASRRNLAKLRQRLDSPPDRICVRAERAFVRELGAGCHAPVGALAEIKDGSVHLKTFAAALTGRPQIVLHGSAPFTGAEELGKKLAVETRLRAYELGLPISRV